MSVVRRLYRLLEPLPVSPSEWIDRKDVSVELKLGYGEQEREAQKFMMLHQLLTADPGVQPMYTPQNRFKMVASILEKTGIKNINEYITSPDQLPPPQPDPMVLKQIELEERKVAAQEMVSKSSASKVEYNAEMERMRIAMEEMRLRLYDDMARQRDLDRKEFEATSRTAIAVEELQMAKDQQAQNPGSGSGYHQS